MFLCFEISKRLCFRRLENFVKLHLNLPRLYVFKYMYIRYKLIFLRINWTNIFF